jgi:hypothetical protein
MARTMRFRSIRPLYKQSVAATDATIDPFRVVSILKLSEAPMEKADLMVMLGTSLEEVEKAVALLACKGIVRVDGGERPEKDMITL